jgi:peptidoglycan/LPS O-acetylase OafA/YrhL
MTFHLAYWSWTNDETTPGSIVRGAVAFPELVPFAWWGRYGVDVFFVISGFVIAYSAADNSPGSFLRSRFLRLVPAVLICASITAIVRAAFGVETLAKLWELWWKSVTFNFMGPWIDGVYWTLPIEIVFYAIVLILVSARYFRAIEILAAVLVCLTLVKLASMTGPIKFRVPISVRWQQLALFYHGAAFAVGVFAWATMAKGWSMLRVTALVLSIVIGAAMIFYDTSSLAKAAHGSRWTPTILWGISVICILAMVFFDQKLSRRLSDQALSTIRTVGLATYPLYLIHDALGAHILRGLAVIGINRFVALAIAMLAMIFVSLTVLLAAERGFRSYLLSKLSGMNGARLESG